MYVTTTYARNLTMLRNM